MHRGYNWHSVSRQVESLLKLRQLPTRVLLPGHGRPGRFESQESREQLFSELARRES